MARLVKPVPFEIEIVKERLVSAFTAGKMADYRAAAQEMERLLIVHHLKSHGHRGGRIPKATHDREVDILRSGIADERAAGV